MNVIARTQEILDLEIAGLLHVRNNLGEGFTRAAERMAACLRDGGKIVVTGIGKNLPVAEKISATLASTGSTSVVLNPVQAMHGDLGILRPGDVLLALSYSGASEELLALIPLVRRNGIDTIAMTGVPDSPLARYSDIVIPVAIEREACPFNMAPTTSTTVTMAVGDALAIVLLETRGFKREDYAKLHPGGAIGRALLLRVTDIMRTGDRVATVPSGARVKDALLAMTQARAGSAAVVDAQGRLLGIFTDGDLRRQLAAHANPADLPIDSVMTPEPIRIQSDSLAVDVLKIFETHKIDDLLVVDAENRLVGAIDVQDLPRLKIM